MLRLSCVQPPLMLSKFLKHNFAPTQQESTSLETIIIYGKVPQAFMNGQYIRNGPNPNLPMENVPYHWFDGDGMLHGLLFTSSNPTFTNRYILTPKYITERTTLSHTTFLIGSILTNSIFTLLSSITLPKIVKSVMGNDHYTTANTALSFHQGRLIALMEGDLPVWVHAPGLETVGLFDYDGQLDGNPVHFNRVIAHPKVDRIKDESYFICNSSYPTRFILSL